jgi:hypothetical protein
VYTVAAGTKEGGSHNDEVCRPGQARGVKGKDEDWRACEERADVLANKFCSRNEGSGAADKKCLLHGAAGSIVDRPTPAGMECALLSLEISEQ